MSIFSSWFGGRVEEEDSKLREAVEKAFSRVIDDAGLRLRDELESVRSVQELKAQIAKLNDELSDLRLKRREEEREIQHKVGLAQAKMTHERTLADERLAALRERLERDAEVSAKAARVEAREEAMKAHTELMREQLDRAERLAKILTEALPSAKILANLTNNGGRSHDEED